MSIAPLYKVQLLAHMDVHRDLLAGLQEEGLVHFQETDVRGSGLQENQNEVSDLDHWIYKLGQAIGFLGQWEEKSLGDKLTGRRPEVSRRERLAALDYDYRSVLEQVEKLESNRNSLSNQIRFWDKERELLHPWRDLDIPIREVRDTESVHILPGAVPASLLPDFEAWADSEPIGWYVIQRDKRLVHGLLLLWAKESARLEQEFKRFEFNPQHFTQAVLEMAAKGDRVADVIASLDRKGREAEQKLKQLDKAGRRLCTELDALKRVYDVLENERSRRLSQGLMGRTQKVMFMEGWIKQTDRNRLQERLLPYAESVEYYLREPEPEEEHPVALENRKAWQPFEMITRLYGLPRPGTLDPTVPLAPFFFIFVGLTVSEAGYGFLVSILSLLFLRLAKPKGGLRVFLILLAILGAANVIIGTLVGGWFGFPIKRLLLLDPLQDPVRFLILALALGFIQVWFGTFLQLLSQVKEKKWGQALVQLGWLALLPGMVIYGITSQPVWGYLALGGAAGIVLFTSSSRNPLARFFSGLYGLYGISGYLSDILSYSRLLALGLATTVIAMVVNTLCQTALGIPWVGWLLAALIFVGGHLFNLGISFLGGFVHSMRLQFVEFFSKFFQSGGKPFKPLALESRYIDFT